MENLRVLLENTLDIMAWVVTNTFVIVTKGFAMKLTLTRRLAYLGLAAVLYAPIGLLLLSRAAAIVA